MKLFGKITFTLLTAIVILWQIPWLFNLASAHSQKMPFTLYSNVINDFAMITNTENGIQYTDQKGNLYSEKQFDSILPAFYARQLYTEGRFPDSICGEKTDYRNIVRNNFIFRSTPSSINRIKPELHFLMESMSGRVKLEMPDDAFRINEEGIEFITMKTNSINKAKSTSFTETMKRKGFRFPAKEISGNPTTRKDYDNGYFLIDSNDKLYHLKMIKGRIFFREIDLPESTVPEEIFVTEFENRKILGFFSGKDKKLYCITLPDYAIKQTGIPEWNPKREDLSIIGNMYDWTVSIDNGLSRKYFALDSKDLGIICKKETEYEKRFMLHGLRFTSSNDKYVIPRIY